VAVGVGARRRLAPHHELSGVPGHSHTQSHTTRSPRATHAAGKRVLCGAKGSNGAKGSASPVHQPLHNLLLGGMVGRDEGVAPLAQPKRGAVPLLSKAKEPGHW
jgi:hypothetical protein